MEFPAYPSLATEYVTGTLYYPYAAFSDKYPTLKVYVGEPVFIQAGESIPEEASIYPPDRGFNPENTCYFNGMGWVSGVDIRTASLPRIKHALLAGLSRLLDRAIVDLGGDYSAVEQGTWERQRASAHALMSGNRTGASFIAHLAAGRQEEPIDLAQKVIEKAMQYEEKLAELLSTYQRTCELIRAAATFESLPAFTLSELIGQPY